MGDGAKTQAKTVNFWIEQKTAMTENSAMAVRFFMNVQELRLSAAFAGSFSPMHDVESHLTGYHCV